MAHSISSNSLESVGGFIARITGLDDQLWGCSKHYDLVWIKVVAHLSTVSPQYTLSSRVNRVIRFIPVRSLNERVLGRSPFTSLLLPFQDTLSEQFIRHTANIYRVSKLFPNP